MKQYAFYFDNSRCTGCRTCEMACKDYKNLDNNIRYRKIYDYESGETSLNIDGTVNTNCLMYHLSISCNHCKSPACVDVCPTGAMHKDSKTGLVLVNTKRCIGCGYCHMACPYNSPKVNKKLKYTVKCDGCIERISAGHKPICVEACPLRALDFGSADAMAALSGAEQADIPPLPSSDITGPYLFIKNSPAAVAALADAGFVTNIKEVL